jgi:hypothetical protein
MTINHKKPGVAFWATVALVGLVCYVLSAGPAEWLLRRDYVPDRARSLLRIFHMPVYWALVESPEPIGNAIASYILLWQPAPDGPEDPPPEPGR